ncbi:MAG: hypothetical protein EPO22_14870, partial [Dehalococcoidia bacterium]
MCAIDALGMPFMLRRDAQIVSSCAGCGADVRVQVRDGAISHAPVETMVWVGQMSRSCVAATDLCPDSTSSAHPRASTPGRARTRRSPGNGWASRTPSREGGRCSKPCCIPAAIAVDDSRLAAALVGIQLGEQC